MKSTAWGYGAMGLIPFVAIGILFPLWPDSWESGLINLFTSYSMVILAFMAGAVWGSSLDEEKSKPGPFGLTTAIVFSLIAFAVAVMPLGFALLILALSFVALFVIELFFIARHVYPLWYTAMRGALTTVVFFCHASLWYWLEGRQNLFV